MTVQIESSDVETFTLHHREREMMMAADTSGSQRYQS